MIDLDALAALASPRRGQVAKKTKKKPLAAEPGALASQLRETCDRLEPHEWAFHQALPLWSKLREQLALAPDAEWAVARDAAAAMREDLPVFTRCGLAYLFPEETGWAAEAASAWLALRARNESPAMPLAGYAVLGSAIDRELAEKLLAHAAHGGIATIGTFAGDAALQHREAALPGLLAVLEWAKQPKDVWGYARASLVKVAEVLATFDDPEVTAFLLERLHDKDFGRVATTHLERFPRTALCVLAPSLGDKSKKAERNVALLDAIARNRRELALEVASSLEPAVGRALARRVSSPEATSAEAPREAWPPVLAAPPWRSKTPRPVMPVVAGLVAPTLPERLVLDDATRAKWSERPYYAFDLPREHQEKMLTNARANADRTTKLTWLDGADIVLHAFGLSDEIALAMWDLPPFSSMFDLANVQHAIARFGDRAIDGAVRRLEVEPAILPALVHVDSPRVSLHLARALRRPSQRALAHRALARFPRTHALALVPVALAPDGKDAELARAALRWMVAAGLRDVVLDAAAHHGEPARAAVDVMLAIDPIELCPAKPPRLSDFADPAALPRVRLHDGSALPEEAMRHLLEMVQLSPVDPPYAGIAQVVEACERGSLDRFAYALMQAWERSGGASASAWALHALGHVGSDSVVKLLAADIRRWPREKAKARALLALEVLARMGTDVALLHLDELSRKAKNRDVEAKAKDLLAQVAEARGLGAQELEDRLVPTLELDAQGGRTIAIGARTLTVRFDEHLEPYLVDAEGKRSDKILKAKGDEADALDRAKREWKELVADAAQISKALIGRLERAMCEARRWDADTFRALFVAHPLTQHLGRRLVWGTFAEGADAPATTFRIAEDGSLADLEDDPLALPEDAAIGIVHPLFLDDDVRDRWGQRFADYEILQPFEQLGRRVERVPPGREDERPWRDAESRSVGLGPLLGALEARGWRVASPGGDGMIDSISRTIGGREVTIGLAPGFRVREARPERVEIGVHVAGATRLGDVPPLVYAEVTRDLAVLGLA